LYGEQRVPYRLVYAAMIRLMTRRLART
jgi:hypothetical protein